MESNMAVVSIENVYCVEKRRHFISLDNNDSDE